MSEGRKLDGDKQRWDLIPFAELEKIVDVITYGARKYAPDNWKLVPDAKARYKAALLRHISAYMQGEEKDSESGLDHLAHAGCNILFLMYFERLEKNE